MQGIIILTEGRSGSNWLQSLTNAVGTLGISKEWFSPSGLGPDGPKLSGPDFIAQVIEQSSTPNKFFATKLFPAHVHWFEIKYKIDLLHHFVTNHDMLLVRLTRRDRVRQAISYARGVQTKQWTAHADKKAEEQYDFEMICRCYFLIDRAYQYWVSYLELRNLPAHHVVYEDMLASPKPFVDLVSNHAGERDVAIAPTKFSVQRDQKTEDWLGRFNQDVAKNGIVNFSTPNRPLKRTISNFRRLVRGEQLKPYPYLY